jgi:hypothetical protein
MGTKEVKKTRESITLVQKVALQKLLAGKLKSVEDDLKIELSKLSQEERDELDTDFVTISFTPQSQKTTYAVSDNEAFVDYLKKNGKKSWVTTRPTDEALEMLDKLVDVVGLDNLPGVEERISTRAGSVTFRQSAKQVSALLDARILNPSALKAIEDIR